MEKNQAKNTDEGWTLFNGWVVLMAVIIVGCKLAIVLGG